MKVLVIEVKNYDFLPHIPLMINSLKIQEKGF